MNTFLGYLTVLILAAVLSAPAFAGYVRERRIDRQLRAAERRPVPAPTSRSRRGLAAHDVARAV
ncbi:hypothetical protein [Streptomyces sp. NPDC050704]|uniref:hypothetical protein n=1 Tax=Streptomyces sp. NPDC050704 TaxID=3157219 RepID=UPI00343C892B